MYDDSLDLLRRLNPDSIESNLQNVCKLQPDLATDLLSSVDTPIKTMKDPKNGKDYLVCDYNRDGDNYRSPYSNTYYPADDDEDAPKPSRVLLKIEQWANDAFNIYRDLYYEGGVSSVYLWDQEDGDSSEDGNSPFDGVILIKKQNEDGSNWDGIHVFEVNVLGSGEAEYKLTSTIILKLSNQRVTTSLNGSLMKQSIRTAKFKDCMTHIENIGSLVEDVETQMRNMLQEVYFGKTRDVVSDLRGLDSADERLKEKERREMVIEKMGGL